MEEVDNIIILTLRQIHCNIGENVESLKEFTTEMIIEATVKCLKVITPGLEMSPVLPPSMSARFRLGTTLATMVIELGYRGEIGYQSFLYSNEVEFRKVLMFLIEKLPKETEKASPETLGTAALLNRQIATEVSYRINRVWTPSFCKSKGICWKGNRWHREGYKTVWKYHTYPVVCPTGLADLSKKMSKETKNYFSQYLPLITQQPPLHRDVAASILETNSAILTAAHEWEAEWNQSGLASRLPEQEYRAQKHKRLQKRIIDQFRQSIQRSRVSNSFNAGDIQETLSSFQDRSNKQSKTKGSRFTHIEKLQFAKDEVKINSDLKELPLLSKGDSAEDIKKKREEEVEALNEQLNDVISRLENMELDIKKFSASIQQMEEQMQDFQCHSSEKEEAYKVKKRTLDLLPDAENNISELQNVVDSSAQRLVNLATQWEKHRAPLIQQHRELRELNANKMSETQRKLEEIKVMHEKMKKLSEETKTKDDLYKQLLAKFERMTKDVNRSAYTRRIMEIMGNIKKQKSEIDKVLIDTRTLQKEINQLSGKLDRTFTVTDELIFRDAKKDDSVRKAYKYLAALHENCNLLIKTVEETGHIMREIRDLEDLIENESHQKILANLERIMADHKQMKQENAVLQAKLKEN